MKKEKQKLKVMRKKILIPSASFGIGLLLTLPIVYFTGIFSFMKYSFGLPESLDSVWPTLQILCR